MSDDPVIVAGNVVLDNRRDRFDANWIRWMVAFALTVGGLCWSLFRMDLTREPVLPDRPFTKADVPLLEKKIKFLKADANMVSRFYPHLKNKAELQAADQAWEEVYYTPEVFPAAENLRRLQNARILEVQPALAGPLRAKAEYEQARYAIANDPAITDKAAAVTALKKRSDPAVKGLEDAKTAAQIKAALADLVGDPELDRAQQDYHSACETAILKRHPELAAFYHDVDNRGEAYHHFMAQANSLTRQLKALQSGATPTLATAAAKPIITPVAAATVKGAGGQVNAATNGPVSPAVPALPEAAGRYGVKVGDTVEISALDPAVAARHALITTMNGDQLTIRVGGDTFAIRWENLIRLKAEIKK